MFCFKCSPKAYEIYEVCIQLFRTIAIMNINLCIQTASDFELLQCDTKGQLEFNIYDKYRNVFPILISYITVGTWGKKNCRFYTFL